MSESGASLEASWADESGLRSRKIQDWFNIGSVKLIGDIISATGVGLPEILGWP
jgi:hypothetical protein